jgi:hypothetical protein
MAARLTAAVLALGAAALMQRATGHGACLDAAPGEPVCDFDLPPVNPHAGMDMSGRRRAQMDHSGMGMGGAGGTASMPMNWTYFVAAEVVTWDYAPSGEDKKTGMAFDMAMPAPIGGPTTNATAEEIAIYEASPHLHSAVAGGHAGHGVSTWTARATEGPAPGRRIGTKYNKLVFFEYTDATFSVRKPRPLEELHLGLLGPLIRAEVCRWSAQCLKWSTVTRAHVPRQVGDTVNVVFRNVGLQGLPVPFSVHAHGVKYAKSHEGSYYEDGSGLTGDSIAQCGCHQYVWEVPPSAGPGPGDPNTIAWLYHGHVDETADTNGGMVGAILVSRSGTTDMATRRPLDVDREFVTLYSIMDENDSPLFATNANLYLGKLEPPELTALRADPLFVESNQMHAINGYVYANLPGLVMTETEVVRWHVRTRHLDSRTSSIESWLFLARLASAPGMWLLTTFARGSHGAAARARQPGGHPHAALARADAAARQPGDRPARRRRQPAAGDPPLAADGLLNILLENTLVDALYP